MRTDRLQLHLRIREVGNLSFQLDQQTEELRRRELLDFMDRHIYPAEKILADQVTAAGHSLSPSNLR